MSVIFRKSKKTIFEDGEWMRWKEYWKKLVQNIPKEQKDFIDSLDASEKRRFCREAFNEWRKSVFRNS